ncbi:MAG: two-component system chemotaxis response regulator CheB [Pseudohongiellaceae bacterium]|jgi:two-component system chemotaxis response regulator CheB
MSVTVLVVDDSGFFRKRVCEILNSVSEIKVVGTASNGKEAIELVKKLNPDVVTMDYEMPVMDGVTAIRHIMAECPTSILMFSSLTYEGARVTLDALEAGAVDFLPKNFEDIARDTGRMQNELKKRILDIGKHKAKNNAPELALPRNAVQSTLQSQNIHEKSSTAFSKNVAPPVSINSVPASLSNAGVPKPASARPNRLDGTVNKPRVSARAVALSHTVDLLVIGASTGGPVALQKVITKLPANFPTPILIIQHMPDSFTPAFAERLNNLSQLSVKHATDGDVLKKGQALLAPGGKQMIVTGLGQNRHVKILEGDDRLTYKPSVDVTFGSAAKAFPGRVLGVVLTGMGADGREGCRMLKQSGSTVWTQDEASCVIYGMPMSVAKAGYSDASITLQQIANRIVDGVM